MRLQPSRGTTMIEAIATMVVLLIGLLAISQIVLSASKQNRANLSAAQAQMVAERELERLTAQGCSATPPCGNILLEENNVYSVFASASGEITNAAIPGATQREFHVAVDVDAPGRFEGAEVGEPQINRVLAAGSAGNIFNVRVTVSWVSDQVTRVVAMQTRMAP